MASKWREFLGWRCEACGTDNVLLERQDDKVGDAAVFDRVCVTCGAQAAGRTIRPAHVGYRVLPREQWRPKRSSRHTP